MRAAASRLQHLFHSVRRFRVDCDLGAEVSGQADSSSATSSANNTQAHCLGDLHGDMAETAKTGYRHPLAGSRLGLLQTLDVVTPAHRIGARAAKSVLSGSRVPNLCRADCIFCVNRHSRYSRCCAALPIGSPISLCIDSQSPHASCSHAMPTGSPSLASVSARADCRSPAATSVAGNKWWGGLYWPVTIGGMENQRGKPRSRRSSPGPLPGPGAGMGDLLDSK